MRRKIASAGLLAVATGLFAVALPGRVAGAELVPPPDWLGVGPQFPAGNGDSPEACRALAAAERAAAARRPITEVEVYRGMGEAYGAMAVAQIAALVPNVGLQFQRGASSPGVTLSWSAAPPLGPVIACKLSRGGPPEELSLVRVVLEPGIVLRSSVSLFLRPGLRAIWHPSSWRLGVGAGLGTTLAWVELDRGAASISPELLLHYGRCCGPGYMQLSVRADRTLAGRHPDTLTASLGFGFW